MGDFRAGDFKLKRRALVIAIRLRSEFVERWHLVNAKGIRPGVNAVFAEALANDEFMHVLADCFGGRSAREFCHDRVESIQLLDRVIAMLSVGVSDLEPADASVH